MRARLDDGSTAARRPRARRKSAALGLLLALAACGGQPRPAGRAPGATDARVVAALTGGAPCSGGACAAGAFQYDTGGRLVRDRGATLGYDAFDQVVTVTPVAGATSGVPATPLAHTYGFDGLRTSTSESPGTAGAATQLWFTQDYTEHGGVREHYLRVGDRIVAKMTLTPPAGAAAGAVRTTADAARATAAPHARDLAALSLAAGLALAAAARPGGRRRRPAWAAGAAAVGPAALALFASCAMLDGTERATAALWQRADTVYFHRGIAPGPVLTTNADGSLREERRYEPFGQPVDATLGGAAAVVDFRREPQNALGKLTDPATGWSYHGARWLSPQTARWTAPDPALAAPGSRPAATLVETNPYAYVSGSPTVFWDPDGRTQSWQGSPALIAEFQRMINANLKAHYLYVDPSGDVSIHDIPGAKAAGPREEAFTTMMRSIADDPNRSVINIEKHDPNPLVLVGSYMLEEIDIADLRALASGGRHGYPPTVLGLSIHEFYEQHLKQTVFHDPRGLGPAARAHMADAHAAAITMEANVEGARRDETAPITDDAFGRPIGSYLQYTIGSGPSATTFRETFSMDPLTGDVTVTGTDP
jgi:RHS repeat-associated protein